jgi:hypothetical protein
LLSRKVDAGGAASAGDVPVIDGEKVASALEYVKCSLAPKPADGAQARLIEFLNGLGGREGLKIEGQKISYRSLQLSVIEGPRGPEVSASYFGPTGSLTVADQQLEEFVGLFGGGDVLRTGEDGRRTLNLGGTVIGLPMEGVFTGGVRFKILESAGGQKKSVVLGRPCAEGIKSVAESSPLVRSYIVTDTVSKKFRAYDRYVAEVLKVDDASGAREVLERGERDAALTDGELAHLIELLRNKGNPMNISPMTRSSSADAAQAGAWRGQIDQLRTENDALRNQIDAMGRDYAARLNAMEREHAVELERLQTEMDKRDAAAQARFADMERDAAARIDALQAEFGGQLRNLQAELERLRAENRDLRAERDELKAWKEEEERKRSEVGEASGFGLVDEYIPENLPPEDD